MDREAVIEYLRGLTEKQFAELFYASTNGEEPNPEFRRVLMNASHAEDGGWELQLVCPVPNEDWVDDAPLCQWGSHHGLDTTSWAKQSVCPFCGKEVYGT
ncbi:MAG TPA: hypothetical protein VF595_05085 [Tepidisphaeraceae bacterium]